MASGSGRSRAVAPRCRAAPAPKAGASRAPGPARPSGAAGEPSAGPGALASAKGSREAVRSRRPGADPSGNEPVGTDRGDRTGLTKSARRIGPRNRVPGRQSARPDGRRSAPRRLLGGPGPPAEHPGAPRRRFGRRGDTGLRPTASPERTDCRFVRRSGRSDRASRPEAPPETPEAARRTGGNAAPGNRPSRRTDGASVASPAILAGGGAGEAGSRMGGAARSPPSAPRRGCPEGDSLTTIPRRRVRDAGEGAGETASQGEGRRGSVSGVGAPARIPRRRLPAEASAKTSPDDRRPAGASSGGGSGRMGTEGRVGAWRSAALSGSLRGHPGGR